mmetsp:Transcript_13357/g.38459  ORF Transcript_13357/g.38459 Transcript_13357/m.38459 type:complete len:86 (-) Transcript_13357:1476-1733(-)
MATIRLTRQHSNTTTISASPHQKMDATEQDTSLSILERRTWNKEGDDGQQANGPKNGMNARHAFRSNSSSNMYALIALPNHSLSP